MDRETKIVWDFMSRAYQKGTLDAALSFAGGLMRPDADMAELLGRLEDALSQTDMKRFEKLFDKVMVPCMAALSGKWAMAGLDALLAGLKAFYPATVFITRTAGLALKQGKGLAWRFRRI